MLCPRDPRSRATRSKRQELHASPGIFGCCMAETNDAAPDGVYQTLSGVAIGGLLISCLFGGVVVVSAVMAIVQGAPFFFPNWVLFIALAGFLVSWWGRNDIRNAEGTKAGRSLATWGMAISLITGAG